MKRLLLTACIACTLNGALANDLARADTLYGARDYAGAIALYTALATKGDVEARLRLGDMYGFGDGAPEDPAMARAWLAPAAAAGNKDAAAALQVLAQRAARKGEIARYADQYDGADMSLAAQGCNKPARQAAAQNAAQILKVDTEFKAFLACYNRYTDTLNQALPPGKLVPAALSGVMSNAELARASQRMDQAYARVGAEARKVALDAQHEYDAWRGLTEAELKRLAVADLRLLDRERSSARANLAESERKP